AIPIGRHVRHWQFADRRFYQVMVWALDADRVGVARVLRQLERLAAAATVIARLELARPAGLLHPGIPAERFEGRRLLPDPLQRVLAHGIERQRLDLPRGLTGQDAS